MKRLFFLLMVLLTVHGAQGQEWRPLPGDSIFALQAMEALHLYDGRILVDIGMKNSEGVTISDVTAWDSLNYYPMGHNIGGDIKDFATYRGNLYVLGSIVLDIGEIDEPHSIGKWTGNTWEVVGNVVQTNSSGHFQSGIAYDGKLFVGDNFANVAGLTNLLNVATWDETQWADPGGVNAACVEEFTIYRDTLIAGGAIWGDGNGNLLHNIVYYDDGVWKTFREGVAGASTIYDFVADTVNDCLYVCGSFNLVGSDNQFVSPRVGKLTDNGWEDISEIDEFLYSQAASLAMYRGQVYCSGGFQQAVIDGDTISMRGFMRHNGVEWEEVGGGIYGVAADMAVYKDELYLAGTIYDVGPDAIPVRNIVRWYMHPDSVTWATTIPQEKTLPVDLLVVYPNPSNGKFKIDFPTPRRGLLVITDLRGRELRRWFVNKESSLELDVTDFETGNYLLSLIEGGLIIEQKQVVVQGY